MTLAGFSLSTGVLSGKMSLGSLLRWEALFQLGEQRPWIIYCAGWKGICSLTATMQYLGHRCGQLGLPVSSCCGLILQARQPVATPCSKGFTLAAGPPPFPTHLQPFLCP